MKKVHLPLRAAIALGSMTLLTLTACSSTQDETATSASSSTVSVSATPSNSSSAQASSTAPQTSLAPSSTPTPSASVTTVVPSAEPTQTPVVQEEIQAPTAPASEQPTAEATAAPDEVAGPSPTVSVITVPAPGNNPVATATASAISQAQKCNYGDIHIAAATAEGAAGSRYITLTFTNAGANPCALSGWPTVNYVDASGNAIGAPASQAAEWTSSGELLQPGSSTTATLRETRAGLYGNTCQAVTASGYQVGIPGTDSSLTLTFPAEACSNKSISQLSVGQVGANS